MGTTGTTPALDLDPVAADAIVKAALARHLITQAEVDAARAAAEEGGKSVVAVLVEDGLIAQRSIDGIAASLAGPTGATRAGPAPGPPAPSAAPSVPGYELVSKLGEGGMGAVWRARQVAVGNREVALKVINSAAVDDEARARFRREGEAAGRVNHENVIQIFDLGTTPDGRPFMALELVPGGDAQKLAERRGGRLGEAEALALVRDAARGVAELAKVGVVHRDIKPANIFLAADGRAKLADLGLARQATGDDRMTASGMIVGTPAFMSPEQASAQPLDVRTDVYALGATLYALVTGRPPFVGRTALVVVAKVLNEEAPDPRDLAPALSAGTARVISRCLAKDPRERFQTAAELVDALQRALAAISGRVPREVPPPRPSGRVISPARRSPPGDGQTDRLPPSALLPGRSAAPIVLSAAIALGILGGAFALRGRPTPPSPPRPPEAGPRVAKRPSAATAPAPEAAAPAPEAEASQPPATEVAARPAATEPPGLLTFPTIEAGATRAEPEPTRPEPARAEPEPAPTRAEPEPAPTRATPLPTTHRRAGFRAQRLNQGTSTLGDGVPGEVRGDPQGRVLGRNARYMVGNSAPVQATEGLAVLHLERAPDSVWWSVRASAAGADELAALGDRTDGWSVAAQLRFEGRSGELLVWVLDPRRATSPNDFALERETPAARIELCDLKRTPENFLLYFSVRDRWAISLVQGDTPLAQREGALPAPAAAALSRGVRLFNAVCAHRYPRDARLLEAGLAFEAR